MPVFLIVIELFFTAPLSAQADAGKVQSDQPNVLKSFDPQTRKKFDQADKNEDGVLDQAEYLATLKPEHQQVGRRDFLISDQNQNQQMEFREYHATPAVPLSQRLFPDPVSDRVQEQLTALQQSFKVSDRNGDEQLSAQEFQEARFAAAIPGLADTSFADWDRNQDGQISQQEMQLLLEIVYGVRTPNGQLLREPSGRVVNLMLFNHLDSDDNGQLSAGELKPQLKSEEQVQKLLKQADQNQDQQLSMEEWKTTTPCWIDTVYYFRRIDKNYDARLDSEELASDSGFHRDLAPYLIPAFDRDGNGILSLYEYQNTPITNPVVKWHVERTDKDNDGMLSEAEFDWDLGLTGRSLICDYFTLLDRDHNQRLDQREFFFNTKAKTPRKLFDQADKDKNGVLDVTEYLATLKPEHQRVGQRDFLLCDHSQNQLMEFEEYLSTPSVPVSQRRFPDPVRDRVQEQLTALQQRLQERDSNGDGELSIQEFQKSPIRFNIPGLEFTSFTHWDHDRNGKISPQEMQLLLEIAYGVRTADGQLLREHGVRVVNWMLFQHLDLDHNRLLSSEELKSRYNKAQQLEGLLKQADKNQDRQLSLAEWKTTRDCWIDPVYYFKRIDKNFDTRLDPDELASDNGFHRDLAPYLIPAFDRDGNGLLSLYEYLNTPITNPIVKWHVERKDRNHDGTLSVNEFDWGNGVSGRSLIHDYFALLDRDHNQRLDKQEFFLQIDLVKAPRDIVFAELDLNKDQALSFEEIFTATKKVINPNDGIPYDQVLSNAETEFDQLDLDHDKQLSLLEFQDELAVVLLPPYTYNPRLVRDLRKSAPIPETDYTIWVVMGVNILLVSAVIYYFLRVRVKR